MNKTQIVEGFNFDSIDSDEDDYATPLSNDIKLLFMYNTTLTVVTEFAKKYFILENDIEFDMDFQSKNVFVTYTSKAKLKYIWMVLQLNGNNVMMMLNAFLPFDYVDGYQSCDTNIINLAYTLVAALKSGIPYCVIHLLNKKVVYKFTTDTTYDISKGFAQNKECILTKSLIDKLPPITYENICKIKLNDIIFEDNETIDYFIDYLYKYVLPNGKLSFLNQRCTLKSEPMYGWLNNGRNTGTTSRYIRKSIKRYDKPTINEGFDFDSIEDTNPMDNISKLLSKEAINYIRNENSQNNQYIRHFSKILEILQKCYDVPVGKDVINDVLTDFEYNVNSMTYNATTVWDYTLSLPDKEIMSSLLCEMQLNTPNHALNLYFSANLPVDIKDVINETINNTWKDTFKKYDCTERKSLFFVTHDKNIIIIANLFCLQYVLLTNTCAIINKADLKANPKTIVPLS